MQVAVRSCLAVLLLALLSPANGSDEAARSTLSFDEAGAKNRPVSKVIALLKEMMKQLEKEGEEDQEIYDKIACWCETNDKEKTKSIADAEARINDMQSKVDSFTADSARLTTEIKILKREFKSSTVALEKATAIREKQLAEFNEEEKELIETITALKAAVTVLSKHHSFLQMPRSHILGIVASVQNEIQKNSKILKGVLTHKERRALSHFAEHPEEYVVAPSNLQVKTKQQYAPQSGEIFGILKQLLETFETNLADAQKDEAEAAKAYEELKSAKITEITTTTEQIEMKTSLLATSKVENAHSKEDIKDTGESLAADEEFLKKLKEKCAVTDAEWEERQKTRADEMKAVSEALSFLSSDDAHDLFTKTFNPSFAQMDTSTSSLRRAQAAKVLLTASKAVHNPRLATLAERVKLDAFVKVKKAIDEMVAALLKEKEDEIKHRDLCISELNENQLITEQKLHEQKNLVAKIEGLTLKIENLGKAIEALKAEIAEMKVQVTRAGEDRAKENKDFQLTVNDQRATQKLLAQALQALKGFYAVKEAALLQKGKQEPPPGFKTYEKNEGGNAVMKMIETIISDAKEMEADAIRDEANAQKAYEDFVKETNTSIAAKTKDIVNKSEAKAKAENSKVDAEDDKEQVMLELEQLANTKAGLHKSCDFTLENFDIRQTARDEEIEALKQAKAILSGANFNEFMQD